LHTIPKEISFKEITAVTSGRVPNRMIIGLTENAGLVGDYKINPWNFENANVRSISLTIGGRQYPSKPFSLDYPNNLYMRAYMQMYEGLGIMFGDAGVDITYEDFKNGYCLYVFDLTSSETANCGPSVIEPSREADVNIQFTFSTPTSKAYSCVVYTETPALMEINKDRNVYMEYTN
jgi:ribonucleoside-diphosphate reductase beta chain